MTIRNSISKIFHVATCQNETTCCVFFFYGQFYGQFYRLRVVLVLLQEAGAMANNSIICSLLNFSSPPFSSKHHELLFAPVSKPHFSGLCGSATVGSRRYSLSLGKPSRSLILISPTVRADSSVKTEPMLPPYNVLITGSTKGFSFICLFELYVCFVDSFSRLNSAFS